MLFPTTWTNWDLLMKHEARGRDTHRLADTDRTGQDTCPGCQAAIQRPRSPYISPDMQQDLRIFPVQRQVHR